jgi:anti-anti-sigma factor
MNGLLEQSEGPLKVVVNLGLVEYLVTTALAKLLSFRRRVLERGGVFALCSLRPPVRDVIRIAQFDELFAIYRNETDAVADLK